MDEIRDLLQRLTTLTEDELATLRSLVVKEFKRLDGEPTSVDSTALMNELADIGEQAMAEGKAREEAQAQAEADKDAARQRIAAISGESEDEPSEEETPAEEAPEDEPETPEAEAPVEEETPAEVPEPVAATGAVQRMARAAGKPVPSPEAATQRVAGVLTASAGHDRGRPIADPEELAREFCDQLDSMPKDGPNRGKVIVASAKVEYPVERKLRNQDPEFNARIMESITGLRAPRYDRRTGALVATGGICGPGDVDYGIGTWATADTPLVDGLPSFEANRGLLRWIQPPDIAEWSGATGIWTEATDAEPNGATKPIVALACGLEQTAYVEAVSTRMGFGNMQSRFDPEQVAANTNVAIAESARIRENNLLSLIEGVSLKNVHTKQILGATRDLLTVIDANVDRYRNLHRLPESQSITVIFPSWLKGMIRADLAREAAHQQGSDWNSLAISNEQIEDLFTIRGVNPLWHLDGQAVNGSVYPAQAFSSYTESAEAKPEWPEKLAWYMFHEGAIQRLDGGRLDLGVVRDATLDATNDYETFIEVFEGIAMRSYKNAVIQFVSELAPTGASSATITPVAP
jgi:hypothetical protein